MKEIRRQIKERQFHKVYLLTGDEDYLVRQAKTMLKHALVQDGDEMNYTLYETGRIDFSQLGEQAQTFPFFSEKRVIMLDRTGVMKSGKDQFLEILKTLPPTTCMIICESEVDKRSKIYKWIKKNEYVREFLKKEQTEKVLLRWIAAMLARDHKQIRESDARYFLELVGNDMYEISNETGKLISYVGDRAEISRADIDSISSGQVANKIFELVASIAGGEKAKALDCYNDLLLLKEPPMRILYLIVRQYRTLLMICNMRPLRKPDSEIAQAAGIPPFAVKRNAALLKGYDARQLELSIERCTQVEEEIKTGRIGDQIGLELLFVGLSDRSYLVDQS